MRQSYFFPIIIFLLLLSAGLLYWHNIVFRLPDFVRNPEAFLLPELPKTKLEKPIIRAADPLLGNPKAKISVVVFADFQCPHCAEAMPLLKELLKKYPDKIKIIWKDFPLRPRSEEAALSAYCAGEQGKFWEYHDDLFENQLKFGSAFYLDLARNLGLNDNLFVECFNSGKWKAHIQANLAEAMALELDGAPYFFVGEIRISGLPSLEELEQYVKNF